VNTVLPDACHYCVVVPTYNNSKTLHRVIDSILDYTSNIIIVNDGSTDETFQLLAKYPQLTQIHFPKNLGKGMALRSGFAKAIELGFDYAITIDSDGQHFATDIPSFVAAITANGSALIIGSRNMTQENVPKKSSFGNKFSNFWFWVETGIRLEDTQSGYRIYPLKLLPGKFFTRKFEFEIEVIVRTAWKGITVKNVPIRILYDPAERVSHFRPFTDFTRISILNTVLVIITVFYIKPRNFCRGVKKKGIRKFLNENVLHHNDSNAKKALSIALGVFIGISPFWGLQTILVLFLAAVLNLNKAISFLFSNISFPPLIPFIIYASLLIGGNFIETPQGVLFDSDITFRDIQDNITQYLIGSFILAAVTAAVFGVAGYLLLSYFTSRKIKI
jgi:glycosyltransferase involved in cell wall biosynthesis